MVRPPSDWITRGSAQARVEAEGGVAVVLVEAGPGLFGGLASLRQPVPATERRAEPAELPAWRLPRSPGARLEAGRRGG